MNIRAATGWSVLLVGILAAGTILAANLTSSVTVGNAAPTVTAVTVNGGSPITLTANTTTPINVNATVTDANGCSDVTNGTTTILLYRNGVTSSTCLSSQNAANCYKLTAFTASSTCTTTSVNTTSTFSVQYFAQATDASSSFPTDGWRATLIFRDPQGSSGTSDSATTTLNTLTAINVTTSSVNYGTIAAGSDTGATNQTTTVANAGNSSSTLQLSGTALISGANSIATSSQHFATSTFTFGGTEQQLSGTPTLVSGFTLTSPTSTTNITGSIFWGLGIPGGTPTGTYTGTSTFTAVFTN